MSRLLALTVLALALAAGMLTATGAQRAGAATASEPGDTCILGIICFPGPSSSPTPSPPTPSPAPSLPVPLPSPTIGLPVPTATSSGTTSPGSPAGASPSASGAPKAGSKKAVRKDATAPPGLVASTAASVLTAGSATMSGFVYQGNVNMPVAGGGTVPMMEFTADSITLAGGVADSVSDGGTSTVTTSPSLAFSGGVTLYATKLSGSLLGIPVTFTPSTVSDVLLRVANLITSQVPITLTNVTTDQPLAIAGTLQTGPLTIGLPG